MRALAVLLLLSSSCALLPGGRPAHDVDVTPTSAALSGESLLLGDARRAREAGALELQMIAVDAGAAGDRISGFLRVPGDRCTLLLARGSAEVDDIDLFAFSDDGTSLGSDERPNKSPTLLVCPPHPERIYVSARVSSGSGLVALGAQSVAKADATKLGVLFGIGGAAAGRPEVTPRLEQALAEHRRGIGGRWQDIRRNALPVEPGTPSLVSFVVEPERCVDAWVAPSEEVSHLDVALLDSDGRTLGRALAHGRTRFLLVCAQEKRAFTLEVRPQAGRGQVMVVLAQSRDGGRSELDARMPVIESTPSVSVGEASTALAARLDGGGYEAAKTLATGSLPVAERTSIALQLRPGCTRIDALGGRPLSGMEAWLWSDDEALLAHDGSSGHTTLFTCGAGGAARIDLEALARPGPFSVEQRRLRQTPELLNSHPLAAGRLLTRVLARGTTQRFDQLGLPKVIDLSEAKRATFELEVPLTRCVDVVLALGVAASGAEVRIVDLDTGLEVERGYGRHAAAARVCAFGGKPKLRVRVELRTTSGTTQALVLTRQLAPAQ